MYWYVCFASIFILTSAAQKFCPEESTNQLTPVTWPPTVASNKSIISDPLCLNKSQELVTRVCKKGSWFPKRDDVPDCDITQSRPVMSPCPPNYTSVLDSDDELLFCYQHTQPQSWNYPCLKSGSSKTIYDLDEDELDLLKKKLVFNDKKLVWLPAKRLVPYGPIVWTTVGDKWGERVDFDDDDIIYSTLGIVQGCLLLDLDKMKVKTDNCTFQYPSVCIFKDDHLLPLHCPSGYAATRYYHNGGRCYGIQLEKSGKTWNSFVSDQCKQPLQILENLENHLFREISKRYSYDMSQLCWTSLSKQDDAYFWYPNVTVTYVNWDSQTNFSNVGSVKGAINEKYRWILLGKDEKLPCMACQMAPEKKEVELSLQASGDSGKITLIVYNPRGLWREDSDDIGIRCFSNAIGFVEVADIESDPIIRSTISLKNLVADLGDKLLANEVEKVVYEIERLDDNRPGEYWCEGHSSLDFEFIATQKIVAPSRTTDEHMFVLKLNVSNICSDLTTCNPDWKEGAKRVKNILHAENVRIMEIENIDNKGKATILYHVSVTLTDSEKCYGTINCNIVKVFSIIESAWIKIFSESDEFTYLSLGSTMFCLPTSDQKKELHWDITSIGDNTAPIELCMQSNGLPVTRQCGGSFLYGGKWKEIIGECSKNYEPTNRTTLLYNIAKGQTEIETITSFLAHDMIVILDDKENLIPADVYFLSLSLKTIVELSDQNSSLVELGDTDNIATAVDSIMNIDESCLNLAQTMNSSNVLLESLDMILSKIAQNESDILMNLENGIDLAVTPLFILQISNPSVSNITGVALSRKKNVNSQLFTDMDVIPLTANVSVMELVNIEGLEIATWIPQDLLNVLTFINRTDNFTITNQTVTSVIIDIFYNDIVFQETKHAKDIVNSRVISLTLPGFESDLPLPLPIIYRRLNNNISIKRLCAYWDFASHDEMSMGEWSKKGCFFVTAIGDLDVCACFHLTHFAQLVLGFKEPSENPGEVIIQQYHGVALNAITLIGCSLSLVGVAGIAATAVLFKSWRQKPGTKVLLQLSAAIALQSLMMVSENGFYESEMHCIILGALLHYSVLAAFMWMLMTALLQFARYVKVLGAQRPSRFMVKFSIVGWGLPVIPVAILLLVDYTAYLPSNFEIASTDPSALCYPQGVGLYFSVLLPVVCIIVTNLTVFILVMRSVMIGPDGKRRSKDPELVIAQLRLSILLFFLLGLSWIFGLLAVTGGRIIFSYLFCLTATLQGFILFIYFVICDPATRVLWVSLVRERSRTSIHDISG